MRYRAEKQTDQNWWGSGKFSPLGYLKYLCFKVLHLALVGRHTDSAPAMSIPVLSETQNDPPRRAAARR